MKVQRAAAFFKNGQFAREPLATDFQVAGLREGPGDVVQARGLVGPALARPELHPEVARVEGRINRAVQARVAAKQQRDRPIAGNVMRFIKTNWARASIIN